MDFELKGDLNMEELKEVLMSEIELLSEAPFCDEDFDEKFPSKWVEGFNNITDDFLLL